MTNLDHLILPVNDRDASVDFYSGILGFDYEAEQPPFSVVRVTPDFTLQSSRGLGPTLYFFDPSKHLIEIRYYADEG